MTKTLKLGFVLGGGVSLGSFSASALAESLKQLVLFADYETGEQDPAGRPIRRTYDMVEVDVFSGASAGAMSLAIMLRCLVNHRDKYNFLGFDNYMQLREAMENRLLGQFGETAYRCKQDNPHKWDSLVAIQTMQEVQAKLWIDEVNLDKLLGTGPNTKKLEDTASFVDRTVVDTLAQRCFQFHKLGERLSYRAHVLGQRVLLACTISNLNFTPERQENAASNNPFSKALNDAATNKIHSEVRVFDFHFRPLSESDASRCPLQWIQYHQADDILVEQQDRHGKSYAKFVRHIERNEVWREVAATAVASGAFPLAFEPVVLNRYQHEYGEYWPKDLQHLTKYPFTYVDGGMFNNEPIREAFRLAAYLDNETNTNNFDRRIIFIDPNVTDIERQLSSNVHNKIHISRSLLSGQASTNNKPAILRIASQVPLLLVAMLNEGRKADAGQIHAVSQQFAWRDHQRTLLRQLFIHSEPSLDDNFIINQRSQTKSKLEQIYQTLDLPPRTLQDEMLRVAREEAQYLAPLLPWGNPENMLASVHDFAYRPNPSQHPHAKGWNYCLALVALDISLDLISQHPNTQIVPIAPFDFYKNDYSLMRLPGGGLAGFAGFASPQASQYEVQYGQYCALRILQELRLIPPTTPSLPLPKPFDYQSFDQNMRTRIQNAVAKRLKEFVPKGIASTLMPLVDGFVQDKISRFIDENLVANAPHRQFQFRVRVGQELFALRGFNPDGSHNKRNTLEAIRADNYYFLIGQLSYNTATYSFSGPNVSEQRLHIDKVGLFDNRPTLSISLPTISPEMLRSPNPVFILDASVETSWGSLSHLPADRWLFFSEVAPLDEALWNDDNLRKLLDKMN